MMRPFIKVPLGGKFALHRRCQQPAAVTGDSVGDVARDGEFRMDPYFLKGDNSTLKPS
jgi:hypothetical protein